MMNEKQIYTDKEASQYLRISQVTLWRERKAGNITFRRAASKIIYTQQDLNDYLERNKRNASAVRNSRNKQSKVNSYEKWIENEVKNDY